MAPPIRKSLARPLLLAPLLAAAALPGQDKPTSRPRPTASQARVHVALSVDWEGLHLREVNLKALRAVRKNLTGIPLTHFLSAAYLTRPDLPRARAVAALRAAILPGDEIGLHIHPWRSLTRAAGIAYRAAPTVWGGTHRETPSPRRADVGHAVVLEAYTVPELRALTKTSKQLLTAAGIPVGPSFRAGAWLAGPKVREAIRAEGFLVDCSATHTRFHDEVRATALPALIRKTWPRQTEYAQPFVLKTPAGLLVEVPDTGALADYITAAEMIAHVRGAVRRADASGKNVTVHLGFHQETAARFGIRIREAVRTLREQLGSRLVFATVAAIARPLRATTPASRPAKKPKKPAVRPVRPHR